MKRGTMVKKIRDKNVSLWTKEEEVRPVVKPTARTWIRVKSYS
jgi:hypothetical protein